MREALKSRLIDRLAAIQGRCYDEYEPDGSTVKPYATVKPAGQTTGPPWNGLVSRYEVALYGVKSPAFDMDGLADETVRALHAVRLLETAGGAGFTCRYEGTPQPDRTDDALQAVVRTLVFSVDAVSSEEAASAASSDAWLEKLCAWTEASAGPPWRVYRQLWPQGYERPAILWRLERLECTGRNAAAFELRKTMVGHVLGRTEAEELTMIASLAAGLGSMARLPVDAPAKRSVSPDTVTANVSSDGIATGQLTVALRQAVPKAQPAATPIAGVHFNGELE